MPPVSVDAFPPGVQMILTAIGFVVAIVVWFSGFLKRPNVTVTKDVVVPNVTVADGQAIRELADQLRKSNSTEEDRKALLRSMMARQQEQVELLQQMGACCRQTNEFLESIDRQIRQENKRRRDKDEGN